MMNQITRFINEIKIDAGIALGDPGVVADIYRLYSGQLYKFSLSFTLNSASAEEVLQTVFLRLVEKVNKLNRVKNLKAYLYRAIRNESLNCIRKTRKEISSEEHFLEKTAGDEKLVDIMSVENALKELPSEQREVVYLKIFQGFNFRQMGEILEISQNTVASRYRYALEKLKTLLGDENEQPNGNKAEKIQIQATE